MQSRILAGSRRFGQLAVAVAMTMCLSPCARAEGRLNEAVLKRYTLTLTAQARGGAFQVERCGMIDGSREGYCLVRGFKDGLRHVVQGLGLEPQREIPPAYHPSCLNLAAFGQARDGDTMVRVARPGIARFNRGRAKLPGNSDNVEFVALYLDAAGDYSCIEYRFPYG